MKYICIALLIVSTAACKKKKIDPPAPDTSASAYLPGQVGSYWIYDIYTVKDGVETSEMKQDSLYISEIKTIRGRSFKKFEGVIGLEGYYADSAQFIIDEDGNKLMATNNASGIFFTFNEASAVYHKCNELYRYFYGIGKQNINGTPTDVLLTADSSRINVNLSGTYKWYTSISQQGYVKGVGVALKDIQFVDGLEDNLQTRFKLRRYKL
ncbi:MAG: hypothetical protein IPK62_16110 [Bacteroidetes bacterium]|nr:hypothetical protein [Bacteroidota bacterium]